MENVNVMQMLHSVHRPQEALDLEEQRHVLCLSNQFVAEFDPEAASDVVATTEPTTTAATTTKKKKQTRAEIETANEAVFLSEMK